MPFMHMPTTTNMASAIRVPIITRAGSVQNNGAPAVTNNNNSHGTSDKTRAVQSTAAQNFLWGADQALSMQQDVPARKMLVKASNILERGDAPPRELMEEIEARLRLIDERARLMPMLVAPDHTRLHRHVIGDVCFEIVRADSPYAALILEARKDVFCGQMGVPEVMEIDAYDRSDLTFHVVATKGDAILGSVRFYVDSAQAHYIQVDRCFVDEGYRNRGMARAMMEMVKVKAGSQGITQIGMLIRCELVGSDMILATLRKLTNQTPINHPFIHPSTTLHYRPNKTRK